MPPFEEHSVRQELGISLQAWYEMTPRERAFEVAAKRIARQINLLQNAEMQDYMRRKGRRR